MFNSIFYLLFFFVLTGCAAGLGENFTCDKVGGLGGCVSMNEVNQKIDSGLFNSNASSAHTTPHFLPHHPKIDSGQPMRTKEYVQKMVVFPYVDASNHYHDSSVMYVVLEKHHWLGRPVRALVKERD